MSLGSVGGPGLLLVLAVAAVGVLHTAVPDHWVPITLLARQQGWSKARTARAALQAGTGHVVSTLAIGLVVWFAGVAFAIRFGRVVDTVASAALVLFGAWIASSAWRELRGGGHGHGGPGHSHDRHGHGHDHGHDHAHQHARSGHGTHGPGLQRLGTGRGAAELSSFEEHAHGLHGHGQGRGDPDRDGDAANDRLFSPPAGVAVPPRHAHAHRHSGIIHVHWHDHASDTAHEVTPDTEVVPPDHTHEHKVAARTAMLLILGSSPMVEGIPAFFAAGRYGPAEIILMAVVFAASTIVTYVLLCVSSTTGLQRVSLGPLERYGELLSGVLIALVGIAFWLWPVL